ncbi:LAFE_0B06942g1_1 [Lachancea fermentati]|uniref:ATP-dependent DNA helicase CHL1 n=1 Tax=Lachancea fermentati TaxID=4955 RepID=A0A1G4M888_LACFM|nr:LAFE_0B06942g1_1 [Lachancea fermentati]
MPFDRTFHHPFKPYDIQIDLMEQIYNVLTEGKKVGIFESPTGTGKTLSLICPTVTWLRENKADFMSGSDARLHRADSNNHESDTDGEPEWVKEAYQNSVLGENIKTLKEYEEYLESADFKQSSAILSGATNPISKRRRKLRHLPVTFEETDYLPEDPNGDSIANFHDNDRYDRYDRYGDKQKLSNEVKALLDKLHSSDVTQNSPKIELSSPLKIFFASRTHSQLSQFASQLTLPRFPPSFEEMIQEKIKFLPMGSRKQLCINPKVSKINGQSINDFCLDTIKKKQCTSYSQHKDPQITQRFRDLTFSKIHDIEELVEIGNAINVCPYYASREVLQSGVEIVALPYQHLLVETTRRTLGIDLKNAIVIIDEAHNLIDTINAVNSADLSLFELQDCKSGLHTYLYKFKRRLNAISRVNLTGLSKLIDILIAFIEQNYKNGVQFTTHEIFSGTNADLLNIHQLDKYMSTSKIAFKIDTYFQMTRESHDSITVKKPPVLFKVAAFLRTLANPSLEGQFFFDRGYQMKYMLLEPSHCFKSIIEDARSVILAGGTMQPIDTFLNDLIPSIRKDQISIFSCNHIVPDENLNAFIVSENFEFTFDKRESQELVDDLFYFLSNLAKAVPSGIVVFFSSYNYLDFIVKSWHEKGFFDKLNEEKTIYSESSDNLDILSEYTQHIDNSKKGAFLFAVVGGRLSEGINFKDDLARAVVMVGLPFPNLFSGELIMKRKHLEKKVLSKGGSYSDAKNAIREFYENICMKAVNQSIGRAIRHIEDYANIYLVDKRYESSNIKKKLSGWVRRRIRPECSQADILKCTARFFARKEECKVKKAASY